MGAVSVWKMQDLLLLLALFFFYHNLQPGREETVLVESEAAPVLITNRYFQWVVRPSAPNGLIIAERVGGLDEEQWIFSDDGKIQNVGTGKFLREPTVGTLVTLADSTTPGIWRLEEKHIVHQPSKKVLTAYKDGSIHLEERKSTSRISVPPLVSRSLGGVVSKLLNIIDFVKDIPLQSQEWKLSPVAPVQCPELGEELQDLERGLTFSHIRADTECLAGVQPGITA